MVSTLTFNFSSFFSPFFAKPLSFFRLANRAISLSSVKTIKRMAFFAHSFGFVYRPDRERICYTVFVGSYLPKVVRVNATSVFAKMVNHHPVTDISVFKIISNSVCPTIFLNEIKSTITVFIQTILPNKTLTNFYPITIKSIVSLFDCCVHVGNDTSYA